MLPVLWLPCKLPAVFPPLPSSPHPFPLCHCHLEVTAMLTLPATHLEHTRSSCGQCWTKRCPAEPGIRV